jgi:hypothetical protein
MERRTVALVALAVVFGVGLALVAGFDPAADGSGSDDSPASPFPTATPTPTATSSPAGGTTGGSGTDGATPSATSTPAPEPTFTFTVQRIEPCGQTCRDVTSSVSNTGEADATGVTVYSRLFVGNSTAREDLAWQGSQRVGTLAAGDTYTATKRVQLSYSEAFAVQRAGGWVTVQTTVESDEKTVTFTRRRNVN